MSLFAPHHKRVHFDCITQYQIFRKLEPLQYPQQTFHQGRSCVYLHIAIQNNAVLTKQVRLRSP